MARKRQRPTKTKDAAEGEEVEAEVNNGTSSTRRVTRRGQQQQQQQQGEQQEEKKSKGKNVRKKQKAEETTVESEVGAEKKPPARRRKTLSQDSDAQRRLMEELQELKAKHEREEKETDKKVSIPKKKPSVEEVERKWQGWKQIFFVGTEWINYDLIFQVPWDFDHLENELFEGELKGKKVFLFGATEPQAIEGEIYFIPVIVAVVGDMQPPKKLGIKSVQMEKEEIIPMGDMKMDWTPVEPKSGRFSDQAATLAQTSHIFMLHCNTRRATLARMKEEEVKKYEYCLPYFFRPKEVLQSNDYPTEVTGMCTIDGRGVSFDFDWEMDDLSEYVDEQCQAHEIKDDESKKILREAIRDSVREAKKAIKEEKEKKKAEIEAIPEEEQKAMNEAQFFKFYPQNDDPNLEEHNLKSPFINRYYGRANKLV